jgi:hypothetical protein
MVYRSAQPDAGMGGGILDKFIRERYFLGIRELGS